MSKLVNKSKLFLKDKSPTILSCIGGAGVVATTVLAVKATPKAMRVIEAKETEKGEPLTKVEIIKCTAPLYAPAMLVGASTIACIFGANVLNKRKQASLMSAYALLDESYKEYKRKVDEMLGSEASDSIIQEIAKDKYDSEEVDKDADLFFDQFSGRYFNATEIEVKDAIHQINIMLSVRDYATLNEFYDLLGIPPIEGGDDLGWTTWRNQEIYWQSWLDIKTTKIVTDDGLECSMLHMTMEPYLNFSEF